GGSVDIGLEAWTVLETEHGPVGFVGLTHPQVAAFTPYAPPADPDTAGIVRAEAERLRGLGAIAVVVLIHFGVNWSVADDGTHQPDPAPVLELLQPTHDAIDAVVLGHTLRQWSGIVDGIPYAQPWAFGAELGVIDLDLDGGDHRVELVAVDGAERWTGPGSTEIDAADATVVGELDAPLTINFGSDI